MTTDWFHCLVRGHLPAHVREVGCGAEDLFAGTGYVRFSGECSRCGRTVSWTEPSP